MHAWICTCAHTQTDTQHNALVEWLITGGISPKPACCTVTALSKLGGGNSTLFMATSDRLPSHPKQKMVEPQTAVLPLMGLISVAY